MTKRRTSYNVSRREFLALAAKTAAVGAAASQIPSILFAADSLAASGPSTRIAIGENAMVARTHLVANASSRTLTFTQNGMTYVMGTTDSPPWSDFTASDSKVTFQTAPMPDYGKAFPPSLPGRLAITLDRISEDEFRLTVAADADKAMPKPIEVLGALRMKSPSAQAIVPFYGEGLVLQASPPEWPDFVLASYQMDMPLAIMTDGAAGFILFHDMPPDDGELALRRDNQEANPAWGIVPRFLAQHNKFGYNRSLRLIFTQQGGYVALLARYREYLKQHGYIVTLAQKAQAQPNIERLRGTVNVWGGFDNGEFFKNCKAAGIQNVIANNWKKDRHGAEEIKALGYLVSQYQAFHHCREEKDPNNINYGHPQHTRISKPEGDQAIVWRHTNGTIEYDRCSQFHAEHARRVLPAIMDKCGIDTLFADVSAALALNECWSKEHPMTRTQDREARQEFLQTCADLGLVLGTEHGRWWSARYAAYHEGMLTLQTCCPWDAGYLKKPDSDIDLTPYLDYGLSPVRRLPLYDLVFHDCTCTTWYWGDSTDWLHRTHPQFTERKDVFNVLTGTFPLYWVNKFSGLSADQLMPRLLETVGAVVPVQERAFGQAMLSHQWMSADRMVQRCTFENGLQTWVNFGNQPFEVATPKGTRVIRENGFVAFDGDSFLHHREAGPLAASR